MVVGAAQLRLEDPESFYEQCGAWVWQHAFIWQNGRIRDIDGYKSIQSVARAVNADGLVVGVVYRAKRGKDAFVFRKETMELMCWDGRSSSASSVNNAGHIVGWRNTLDAAEAGWNGYSRAVVWKDGDAIELETDDLQYPRGVARPHDGISAYATDINDRGQIVGAVGSDAFFWDAGELTFVGLKGYSCAVAINERAQAVGSSWKANGHERAWLWEDGRTKALAGLGGPTGRATDINNHGEIVGVASLPGPSPDDGPVEHGVLWRRGDILDLNDLLVSSQDWVIESANAINDHGHICGTGIRDSSRCAVLLVPGE
jgi:probable HAF family extracellular repeat protein